MGRALPTRRMQTHLAQCGLLPRGGHVLLALSGGLDSVVLLHLLRFGVPDLQLRITAAHFDHGMRADSAADALWVAGLCRTWGVPLRSARTPSPLSGEAMARAARYAFLYDTAAQVGADVIATAHQRDDQAETVLLRLARGTGMAGLAGIPARRGRVVRPLLPFARAELEAYARDRGVDWRDDPSNRELRFARNRVRHVLLPALERAAPGAAGRLVEIAALAAAAEAAWRGLLPELVKGAVIERGRGRIVLARGVLLGYDPPVRARVLRSVARRLGAPLGRAGTAAAVEFTAGGRSGRSLHLAGGLRLDREFDRIELCRPARSAVRAGDRPLSIPGPEAGGGVLVTGGRRYDVAWGDKPPGEGAAAFDPGALAFPLELRGWRPGDRIRLDYGSKKLKKLLAEFRVPRSTRAAVPVLAEQGPEGRVLWVAGLARAACARVRAGEPAWYIRVRDERES